MSTFVTCFPKTRWELQCSMACIFWQEKLLDIGKLLVVIWSIRVVVSDKLSSVLEKYILLRSVLGNAFFTADQLFPNPHGTFKKKKYIQTHLSILSAQTFTMHNKWKKTQTLKQITIIKFACILIPALWASTRHFTHTHTNLKHNSLHIFLQDWLVLIEYSVVRANVPETQI